MEAVKFPMVSFYLRSCSTKVEFKEILLQLISQNFYDDAAGYVRECTEFDHLRASAIDVPWDFTGCNTLKKYYCQLCYLLNRFPFLEGTQVAGLDFTWDNEYTDHTDTSNDVSFERSNVLYNIAALHSYLGAQDNRSTPEGMQTSCTHFQAAAGALKTLQENSASAFSSQFTSEILLFQEQLMLAQAQECILEKAMSDGRKAVTISKVAIQCSEFYKRALEYMEKNISVHNNQFSSRQVKTWKKFIELKICYHKCVHYYYLCVQCEESNEYGDRVTYSQAAVDKYSEISTMSHASHDDMKTAIVLLKDVVIGKRDISKKENDFIYHGKVPSLDSLPPIKGAVLVKGVMFDVTNKEVAGNDIFYKLVPIEAHETSSVYSEEKAKLLREVQAEIEQADDNLAEFMSSILITPEQLNPVFDNVPDALVEKCASISLHTEIMRNLSDAKSSLNDSSQRTQSDIEQAELIITNERQAEQDFQAKYGKREELLALDELSAELEKFKTALVRASASNKDLDKYVQHIELLASGLENVKSKLPKANDDLTDSDMNVMSNIRRLFNKIDEMRTQRDQLLNTLKQQLLADDITKQLVNQQNTNHKAYFTEQLKKHAATREYIKANLSAQPKILKAITETNVHYVPVKHKLYFKSKQRKARIEELLYSYSIYEDLLDKLRVGIEWHDKLHYNVKSVLEEVTKLHTQRTEQREKIIKAAKPKAVPPPRPTATSRESPNRPSPTPSPSTGPPRLKDYLPFMKVGGSASSALSAVSTLSDEIPDDFDIDELDDVELPAADSKPRLKDFIPFMNKPSRGTNRPSSMNAQPQALPSGLSDLPPEALKYLPAEFRPPNAMGIPLPPRSNSAGLPRHTGGIGAPAQPVNMRPPQPNMRPQTQPGMMRPPNQHIGAPVQPVSMPQNIPPTMPSGSIRPTMHQPTPNMPPHGHNTMLPQGIPNMSSVNMNQPSQGYIGPQAMRGPAPSLPPKSSTHQLPQRPLNQQPAIHSTHQQGMITPNQMQPIVQAPPRHMGAVTRPGFSPHSQPQHLPPVSQPNHPQNSSQAGQMPSMPQLNQGGGQLQQQQITNNPTQIPPYQHTSMMQPGTPNSMASQMGVQQPTATHLSSAPGFHPSFPVSQAPMNSTAITQYSQQPASTMNPMSSSQNQVPFSHPSMAANSPNPMDNQTPANLYTTPHSSTYGEVSMYSPQTTGYNVSTSGVPASVNMTTNTTLTTQQFNNVVQQNLQPPNLPTITGPPAQQHLQPLPTTSGQQNLPATSGTPAHLNMQQTRLPTSSMGHQTAGLMTTLLPNLTNQPGFPPTQGNNARNVSPQSNTGVPIPGGMKPSNPQQIPGRQMGQPQNPVTRMPVSQPQAPNTLNQQTSGSVNTPVWPQHTNQFTNQTQVFTPPHSGPNTVVNTSLRPMTPQGNTQNHPLSSQPHNFQSPNQLAPGAGAPTNNSMQPQVGTRPLAPGHPPNTNSRPAYAQQLPTGQPGHTGTQMPTGQQMVQRPQFNQQVPNHRTQGMYQQGPQQQFHSNSPSRGPADLLSSGVCSMSGAVMTPQSNPSSGRSTPLSSISQPINNNTPQTTADVNNPVQHNNQQSMGQSSQLTANQQSGAPQMQHGQINQIHRQQMHAGQQIPTGQQDQQRPTGTLHGPPNTQQNPSNQSMLPGGQQTGPPQISTSSVKQPVTQSPPLRQQITPPSQRPVQSVAPTFKPNSHIDDMAGVMSSSINPNEIGTFIDWSKATEKPKQPDRSPLKPVRPNESGVTQRDVREPYSDESSLSTFTGSVERYQKQIAALTKASLMGPRPLDKQWQDLIQEQDRESKRNSTAAALSEATRNRCQDAVPYDKFRVVLPDQKNDYINASLIDNMAAGCPRVIATQGPLHQTETDFWTMIVQQKVETIVNLSHWSDSDSTEGVRYWPRDRNDKLSFGNYLLTLLLINNHKYWVERKINITNLNTKETHVVTQLHYNNWSKSGPPDTMSLLMFINEVAVWYNKQRKSDTPITVHCGNGCTKTGVFLTLYTGVYNINTGYPIPDIYKLVTLLRQRRKSLVSNIDDYLFCHTALLYYVQDILVKKGILISHASFSNPLPQPGDSSRNASSDFIMSDTSLASLGGWYSRQTSKSTDEQKNTTPKSIPNQTQSITTTDTNRQQTAEQDTIRAVSGGDSNQTSTSVKQPTQINVPPLTQPAVTQNQPAVYQTPDHTNTQTSGTNEADTLATLTDPNTFNIGQGRQRITKADFLNPEARPKVDDPTDPFSSIDAMWSIDKTS